MLNTANLHCDGCGMTFNLERDGGNINSNGHVLHTVCATCAKTTNEFDARVHAARILLAGSGYFVGESPSIFEELGKSDLVLSPA